MPFHTNPNTKSQRTRWLENFYPKFSDATRKLIRDGFNQTQIAPPMAIYFPDNLSKSKEETLKDLLARVTGGGGGGGDVPPVGPEGPGSSTDSNGEPSATTDTPDPLSTTGGGGTTGSNGSGSGVTTSGDYTTSETGSATDEGSTTGGGGTTMSGGEVQTGFTTGGSGTIIVIPPDTAPDPPPDTGGSGTGGTGYLPAPCDVCMTADAPPIGCGVAHEFTIFGGGGNVSVPWAWSDCFELEVVYGSGSDDGMGGCNWNPRVCALMIVDPFGNYISNLCSCALHYGCENEEGNCFDPSPPGELCAVEYACCYHKEFTDLSYQCLTSVVTGSAATIPSAYVCRICPR